MTTAYAGAFVALLISCSLDGCVRSAVHTDEVPTASARSDELRFDNEGNDRVDVYLVGDTHTWRLGRLEAGETRPLKVPGDIPVSDLGRLQLVVLANATISLDPLKDPRAVSRRVPLGAMLGQRWAFVQGNLTSRKWDAGRTQSRQGASKCVPQADERCS